MEPTAFKVIRQHNVSGDNLALVPVRYDGYADILPLTGCVAVKFAAGPGRVTGAVAVIDQRAQFKDAGNAIPLGYRLLSIVQPDKI